MKPAFLKGHNWGGYYVDSEGNSIGVTEGEPGNLGNETLRAIESSAIMALNAKGYFPAGLWPPRN